MSNSVIYIHKGYSWYVPLALRNARRFYGGDVHYIGDAYGCFVARMLGVRAHRLRDYHGAANEFAKIYRHHSTLGYEFELFCIQRWFVLMEFLKRTGRDSCIYLDTDVLLTRNLSELIQQTTRFGLTFTGYSAHVCFVNRLAALENLCNYITGLYDDPANEMRMVHWRVHMVRDFGGGGVSDMTMFWWLQKERPDLIGDYKSIFGDSPIDVSLDDVLGFMEDGGGFKRLDWIDGQPFAIADAGQKVSMVALHHQGRAKEFLEKNFSRIEGKKTLFIEFYWRLVLLSYKFFQRYCIILNPSKAPRF